MDRNINNQTNFEDNGNFEFKPLTEEDLSKFEEQFQDRPDIGLIWDGQSYDENPNEIEDTFAYQEYDNLNEPVSYSYFEDDGILDKIGLIDEIDSLYIRNRDSKFNIIENYNNTEWKYCEFEQEYTSAEVRVYRLSFFNDKTDINRKKLLVAIAQLVFKDNPQQKEEVIIKSYIKNFLKIDVLNVFSYKDIEPVFQKLIVPVEIDTNEFKGVYLRNINEETYIGNEGIVNLSNAVNKIRFSHYPSEKVGNNLIKAYHPEYINTRRDGIDIKIPTSYTREDFQTNVMWDYEYVINPIQNLDQDNPIKGDKNIFTHPIDKINNITLLSAFSPKEYERLKFKYHLITTLTRPIIYILRGLYSMTDENTPGLGEKDSIFSKFVIHQLLRQQEDSRRTHSKITYTSENINTRTFPSIVLDAFGKKPEELGKNEKDMLEQIINGISVKTKRAYDINDDEYNYLSAIDSQVAFMAIYSYMYFREQTIDDICKEYNILETIREQIRYQLFIQNLAIKGNILELMKLVESYKFMETSGLMDYGYTLYSDFYEEDSNLKDCSSIRIKIKEELRDDELELFEERLKQIEESLLVIE